MAIGDLVSGAHMVTGDGILVLHLLSIVAAVTSMEVTIIMTEVESKYVTFSYLSLPLQKLAMKPVTAKQLKEELNSRSPNDLRELCLRLSRFKKENKELLTYLLFDALDEQEYINGVKEEIDEQFKMVNRKSYYLLKKNVSKILRITRKYIRYSKIKKTEVELLIYFCKRLKGLSPSMQKHAGLLNLYNRQVEKIILNISLLHEDLRGDYDSDLEELTG
jgi:hypothetical protein